LLIFIVVIILLSYSYLIRYIIFFAQCAVYNSVHCHVVFLSSNQRMLFNLHKQIFKYLFHSIVLDCMWYRCKY